MEVLDFNKFRTLCLFTKSKKEFTLRESDCTNICKNNVFLKDILIAWCKINYSETQKKYIQTNYMEQIPTLNVSILSYIINNGRKEASHT